MLVHTCSCECTHLRQLWGTCIGIVSLAVIFTSIWEPGGNEPTKCAVVVRKGKAQFKSNCSARDSDSESICRNKEGTSEHPHPPSQGRQPLLPLPLQLLKSLFHEQRPQGITLAQTIFTWRQVILCLLLSDKCSCQGFVFCNVSLSYLFACFDFWSFVGRKTAKTVSPVSYKYC